jgi:hypothetical protein
MQYKTQARRCQHIGGLCAANGCSLAESFPPDTRSSTSVAGAVSWPSFSSVSSHVRPFASLTCSLAFCACVCVLHLAKLSLTAIPTPTPTPTPTYPLTHLPGHCAPRLLPVHRLPRSTAYLCRGLQTCSTHQTHHGGCRHPTIQSLSTVCSTRYPWSIFMKSPHGIPTADPPPQPPRRPHLAPAEARRRLPSTTTPGPMS